MSDMALLFFLQAIKPDGGWLVFDMRGKSTPAENFSDPQVQMLAPILYGFSVHICLPSGACFPHWHVALEFYAIQLDTRCGLALCTVNGSGIIVQRCVRRTV